ncbi:e50c3034-8dd5-4921-a55a-3aaf44e20837 [Sclerotinia trifoliorum]|uniref:E50c3034-8dd5-4921-a55a-3aaf44e20837 n=1 Tax=Sclerotinia trifoliorum TaxID=28548 RepID=A0A8H2W1S8_9HELO|nr:e50c3034-8dd5-4921-a55a-3aaf44e20837 [Sclerotinia trifoliorum]
MPACTLRLLSLAVAIPEFLSALSKTSVTPLTIGRVVRWIVLPTSISIDPLLARNIHWDILMILPNTDVLPSSLQNLIIHQWQVTAGVPSRLIQDFTSKNEKLLKSQPEDIPPLTGRLNEHSTTSSAQALELSPPLLEWIKTFSKQEGRGAVSMLNLLAFQPGLKEQYLKYGVEFAKSIGSKRGGVAKIVGTVIHEGNSEEGSEWDEVALAHYPSIEHFADMLASEDYQEVNHKYRVGSLKDTFILCTTELNLPTWNKSESRL